MLWPILVLISAFIYSLVNIIDKVAISKEFKDPILATFIYGVIALISFGSIGFFVDVGVSYLVLILSLLTGVLSCGGVYLYYYILKKVEVSSFMPLLSVSPIFVLILAFIFLGERLSAMNYIGIAVLIGGAIMISLNEHKLKLGFNKLFLLTFGVILIFAVGAVLIKFLTFSASVWQILFWGGIGSGIITLPLILFPHPHIRKRAKKGVEHLILSNFLTVVGAAFVFFAISLGPVSLVSALGRVKLLFVLFEASLLSIFYPKILKEKVSKKVFFEKLFAIIVIIIGAFLII